MHNNKNIFLLRMTSFEQDKILFSDVTTGISKPGKFYNEENGDFSKVVENGNSVKPFINAVELDWNGAKIDDLTVTTTGELLAN